MSPSKTMALAAAAALAACLAFTGCGGTQATSSGAASASSLASSAAASSQDMSDAEIVDAVVDNFKLLAEVPRPSHHEEKISAFLMNWAKDQGFEPVQDSVLNVMFDVPATEGMEGKPLTILQVHMDMVVAAEDGKDFDPLNDPITVVRNDEENTLTADGTSLGADDGSGVAIVMAAAQGKMAHGPLRVIVTTDEEDGMDGAFGMDASWLDGAKFLINVDNEVSNQVLVSTAAGDSVRMTKDLEFVAPTGDTALAVELSGLKGGHSGVEIDKGRLNGVIGLATFLARLDAAGIAFELASFEGGTAGNAIPPKARAVIVVDAADKAKVEQEAATWLAELKQDYADVEDAVDCTVAQEQEMPQVLTAEEKDGVLKLLTEIVDGVHTMSADLKDLVESSSNLGIFKVNEDGLLAVTVVRSSLGEKETEIVDSQLELARSVGYEVEVAKQADPWPYDPNSELVELAKEVYKELNGEDIDVAAVHAGLECGTFKVLKPDLDMISIGPDLTDGHTPDETLYLDSVPKTWHLLEGILARAA